MYFLWITTISIVSLIGEIGKNIWLPLWLDSSRFNDSKEYYKDTGTFCIISIVSVIIFVAFSVFYFLFSRKNICMDRKIMFLSINSFISNFMTAYTSSSYRTSLMFQSLLSNASVPLTAIIRAFWLKKIPTERKSICIVFVVLGLAISIYPVMMSSGPDILTVINKKISSKEKYFWMFAYVVFSVLMPIFTSIITEDILKKPAHQNLEYSTITNDDSHEEGQISVSENRDVIDIWALNFIISAFGLLFPILFWVDLTPMVGYSKNITDFSNNYLNTMKCTFGFLYCHKNIILFGLLYVVSLILSLLAGNKIIQDSDGSLFWTIIANMANPLTIVFWILFKSDPLIFQPHFIKECWYTIVGLAIMVPALIIYALDPNEFEIAFIPSQTTICGCPLIGIRFIETEDS